MQTFAKKDFSKTTILFLSGEIEQINSFVTKKCHEYYANIAKKLF